MIKREELISIMNQSNEVKVVDRKYSDYNIFRWGFIVVKAIVIVAFFGFNIFVRKAIVPFVPFAQVKRYMESIVNLFCMRITLLMLGFINFQCESFAFFRKDTNKITLKSGFVGVGTHKSIVDYLYYSYLLNPVFVRLIIYQREGKEELFYSPLSFMEGLVCALDYRGFDPIIVRNDKQYKAIKYRKLALKTLISQCFEQLNGPIFILLPGLLPKTHISINKTVAQDIYENEIRFQRSLVGFCVKPDERAVSNTIYKNQLFLIFQLLSRLMWLKIEVQAIEYRKWKHRYDRVTYSVFVDKFYEENGYEVKEMDYEKYLGDMNLLFRPQVESKQD